MEIEELMRASPTIRVKVAQSLDVKAGVAPKEGGEYEISMSQGVFVILNTIFSRILANPRFMPWIGHKPAKGSFLKNLFGMRLAWPWPGRAARADISIETVVFTTEPPEARVSRTLPRDVNDDFWGEDFLVRYTTRGSGSEREQAAEWLTWLAVRFVLAHEVRHVLAGHSRYCNSRFGFAELSESRAPKPRPPRDHRKLRALEADADAVAMETLLIHLYRIQLGRDNVDMEGRRYVRDPWHVLLVAILCSHAVCYVQDPPRRSPATLPDAAHPSYSIRRILTFNKATNFIPFLGYKKTNNMKVTQAIALQVERNLGSVFGAEGSRLFDTLHLLQAVEQEVALLEDDRKAAFTELKPYSYVKLF